MKKRTTKARFYVYELIDPRTDEVFYVGKGSGNRVHVHERNSDRDANLEKARIIREITSAGESVVHRIVADGLDENGAFALERETIIARGPENLTNIAPGRYTPEERAELMARDGLRQALHIAAQTNRRQDAIGRALCEMAKSLIEQADRDWPRFRDSFYTQYTFGKDRKLIARGFAPRESHRRAATRAEIERLWDEQFAGKELW